MPVLKVPAGEEGGPGGLPNLLKKKEKEEDEEEKMEDNDEEEEMEGKRRAHCSIAVYKFELCPSPFFSDYFKNKIKLKC